MGLSSYNGFPGKVREASTKTMEQMWCTRPELPRPEALGCQVCFQTEGTIQGHLEDYSRLDVYMPLCVTCHLILHMRWQLPDLWEDYRLAVRHGFRGEPLELRVALGRIKQLYPNAIYDRDELYVNPLRPSTVLDMICPVRFVHPNVTDLDL